MRSFLETNPVNIEVVCVINVHRRPLVVGHRGDLLSRLLRCYTTNG